MKHTAIQNRQNISDACGGNFPEKYPNLQNFIPNQSHSVTLPLVSDKQRLIWTYSYQTELPANSVVELSKTFDRFPYVTQRETNALAQRCFLHPDQVKVWFMVQRLRYGISWDFNDIQVVRRKFKSNQGKDEQRTGKEGKADGGKKQTCKRKVGVSRGEKMEETPKKQKQVTETGDMGEERMKQMPVQLTGAELEGEQHAVSVDPNNAVTDVGKLKRLIEGTSNPKTDSKTTKPKPRCQFRTQTQVAMMRKAFLQCQYPDHEDYIQLSTLIGLNRSLLVQWYCDTRYHIKRGRPRWLSREQHRHMLANIKYSQFLRSVIKMQPAKSNKRIEWKKALDGGVSCAETDTGTSL